MIDQLFGSKTRVKLLHLFMNNPNRSFYVREITRKIDEQINSVRRELSNMLTIGIITSDSSNNRLYYEVNQKYPHYQALRSIFAGKKSTVSNQATTTEGDLTKRFRELGAVQGAMLTGRFVRDEHVPVDMLIVGDINKNKLEALAKELEKEEGFEIRYSVLSLGDFKYRVDIKDRFVDDIIHAKKTVVIDGQELFKES